MKTATITLKPGQGTSYNYKGKGGEYEFRAGTASQVTDPADVAYLANVGCLEVTYHDSPAVAAQVAAKSKRQIADEAAAVAKAAADEADAADKAEADAKAAEERAAAAEDEVPAGPHSAPADTDGEPEPEPEAEAEAEPEPQPQPQPKPRTRNRSRGGGGGK